MRFSAYSFAVRTSTTATPERESVDTSSAVTTFAPGSCAGVQLPSAAT